MSRRGSRPRWRRGAPGPLPGFVAGDVGDFDLGDWSGDELPPLAREVVERAGNDYWRWERQVARTGHCCRPIRLKGRLRRADPETGELWEIYSTEGQPDGTLLVACGSRRASRCRSCAYTYRGDAYQVVVSGMRGGKGVPAGVADHPMVFATFTAPSFGVVHAHRSKNGRVQGCRPRRDKKTCPHGVALGCSAKHKASDPRVGQPLCPDCFDAAGQVIWNAFVPALWRRTVTYVRRGVARAAGMTEREFKAFAGVHFAKVAEYQRRGAVHLHVIVRLDGAGAGEDGGVRPPPAGMSAELLVQGLEAAREAVVLESAELAALGRQDCSIRWGTELDVRPMASGAGELTAELVAVYVSKYSVKQTEGLGLPDRPITYNTDVEALAVPDHIRSLVRAAWELGGLPQLEGLKLRGHAIGLGFGGHFLTKSRRYSTTFRALGEVRREFARRRHNRDGDEGPDAWGPPGDDDQVMRLGEWFYLGWGYRTRGEAYLAASAAARARDNRRLAREEMANWVAA